MKKYIEIEEGALNCLNKGKYVEGSLHRHEGTGIIIFNSYHRKPRLRLKDKIIRYLEHGWVKESADRIKIYESLPKEIGTPRIMSALDREMQEAKNALIDREIINFV